MRSHHAVKLEVSIEPDRSVGAVEGEGDVGHIRPSTLLQSVKLFYCLLNNNFSGGLPFICCCSQMGGGRK